MRKYVIGILVGFLLSFAIGAHAEVVNMIGKAVDGTFPFKINGQKISQDVVVIDGTSYIPVRAASELFGYDIDFDAVNKEVLMQSKSYKGLSDFEKSSKNMGTYNITSTLDLNFPHDSKGELLQIDGNYYISLTPAFSKQLKYDHSTETVTIEFNGNIMSQKKTDQYTKDINLITINGNSFIKLSSLGLKARIDGDTLWIEKQ